jgi:hypothetical protein
MNWRNARRLGPSLAAPLGLNLLLLSAGLANPAFGAEKRQTRNLILETADGLRWQDVFRGNDPALMNEKEAGMEKAEGLRKELWADTPDERRRRLMPFFWSEIARNGLIVGNRDAKSDMKVTNGIRVSYPGYSEILTGRAQDDVVHGNDPIQNPAETILEFLRRKWNLPREKAALFGSWETFQKIGEHVPGAVFINSGFQRLENGRQSRRMRELSATQFDLVTAWDTVRHDYITFEMAREYLHTKKPRVMHIALGETDDWAHDKRYDLTLKTASYFDRCLAELWKLLQSEGFYRGKTTLVITSDHGRGATLADWTGHGAKVEGAEYIWAAFLGPDTPATGEARNTDTYYQRDIAPTMLKLAGIDPSEMEGTLGKPIQIAIAGQ